MFLPTMSESSGRRALEILLSFTQEVLKKWEIFFTGPSQSMVILTCEKWMQDLYLVVVYIHFS